MVLRIALTFLVSLCLFVGFGPDRRANAQELASFPDISGKWAGQYAVAFPKTHSLFPDQMLIAEHEFDFYKQDANLVWVEHRWRRKGEDNWYTEYGTGTFHVDAPTRLTIVEIGPEPSAGAQTGVFSGQIKNGTLFLTYNGVGGGATFSSKFERKSP